MMPDKGHDEGNDEPQFDSCLMVYIPEKYGPHFVASTSWIKAECVLHKPTRVDEVRTMGGAISKICWVRCL